MKYYGIEDRRKNWRPFNFIIGGRGIGKSYSAVSFMINEAKGRFLYVRNYETQIDTACTEFGNPFRKVANDTGRKIYMKKHKNFADVIEEDSEGNKTVIGGAVHASRYISLKSLDLSWADFIFFDEFIEDRSLSFAQGDAVKSIQETCNRNRELEGRPPVYMFMLSNSEKLNNATLRTFGLIPIIESMMKTGQQEWNNKRVHLELPKSEISELKADTALYEALSDNDRYKRVALSNEFANDSFYGIKKRNVNEYTPFLNINELFIYKHKSAPKYYVCLTPASKIKKINTKDQLLLFRSQYGVIFKILIAKDAIEYESFTVKSAFEELLMISAI